MRSGKAIVWWGNSYLFLTCEKQENWSAIVFRHKTLLSLHSPWVRMTSDRVGNACGRWGGRRLTSWCQPGGLVLRLYLAKNVSMLVVLMTSRKQRVCDWCSVEMWCAALRPDSGVSSRQLRCAAMSWWPLCSGSAKLGEPSELIWLIWLKYSDTLTFWFWLSVGNLLQDELREEDSPSSAWRNVWKFPRCKTHPHQWKRKQAQQMGTGTLIQVGFYFFFLMKIWLIDQYFLEMFRGNGCAFLELVCHQLLAFAVLAKPNVYRYGSFQVLKRLDQYSYWSYKQSGLGYCMAT